MSFKFMAAVTSCSDFGAPQNKVCHCFYSFPIYLPWSDGKCQMPWSSFSECWALKPSFSLSSFTFIKRLFNSSSLSAIRVVSSAYLKLLIFLPAVLIPACASSSPALLVKNYFVLHLLLISIVMGHISLTVKLLLEHIFFSFSRIYVPSSLN